MYIFISNCYLLLFVKCDDGLVANNWICQFTKTCHWFPLAWKRWKLFHICKRFDSQVHESIHATSFYARWSWSLEIKATLGFSGATYATCWTFYHQQHLCAFGKSDCRKPWARSTVKAGLWSCNEDFPGQAANLRVSTCPLSTIINIQIHCIHVQLLEFEIQRLPPSVGLCYKATHNRCSLLSIFESLAKRRSNFHFLHAN